MSHKLCDRPGEIADLHCETQRCCHTRPNEPRDDACSAGLSRGRFRHWPARCGTSMRRSTANRVPAATAQGPDASLHAYYEAAWQQDQAALCLSGGGIRSAAFSLGVLQALAQQRIAVQVPLSLHGVRRRLYRRLADGVAARHNGGDVAKVQNLLAVSTAPPELRRAAPLHRLPGAAPGLASRRTSGPASCCGCATF